MVESKRFFSDFLSRTKSNIPKANPAPTIGPIKGEINIAPMTTAVEFTFNPTDATRIAQAKIQRFGPLKDKLLFTVAKTLSLSSSPL